jgi:hypothetical protein
MISGAALAHILQKIWHGYRERERERERERDSY